MYTSTISRSVGISAVLLLLVPFLSLAHQPHPAGTPAHPLDAPDYHPLEQTQTNTAVTTVTVPATDTSALLEKIALLQQLLALLQQRFALMTGSTPATTGPTTTSGRTYEVQTDAVTIYTENGYRYFKTKAIPNHDTGTFPNSGNPNTISEQDLEYKVTLNPSYTGAETAVQLPGIALNGIPFEPGTAERNGTYNIEGLQDTYNLGMDENNAHVQPTGLYHYHGVPEGYLNTIETDADPVLIGYAADGFPMYHSHTGAYTSGWELIGKRSDGSTADGTYTQDFIFTDAGTLDECNGAWLDADTYAYFVTDEFPYISRCLNGIPDESFAKSLTGSGQKSQLPGGQLRGY